MNTNIRIQFLGREYGLLVRDKLVEAGYELVDFKSQQVDLLVVGFWGDIVKKDMLEKPKYGAINVHPSLLPKYRGPTPVPATILAGETETGVTIIKMDEEVDHGPLLAQREFQISSFEFLNGRGKPTTPELLQILWEMGADLLIEILPKYIAGEITPNEQDHNKATFTEKLTREHGRIDWNKDPEYIDRQIRAYTPWPGAYTFMYHETRIMKQRLKILEGKPLGELVENRKAGEVFLTNSGDLAVQCGDSALIIKELQLEGKKPTLVKEFLLGHKNFIGITLV